MNGVYIIERCTGIGVVAWAFLAVAIPAAIFFIVLRRLRAAENPAAVEGGPRWMPGIPAGHPVEEEAVTMKDSSTRANSPIWWELGDNPVNLVKPDPPDWVQRNDS